MQVWVVSFVCLEVLFTVVFTVSFFQWSINNLFLDISSFSALHLVSCHIDLVEIMQLCLDNGCNVDALNTEQWTPLFFAIKSNNLIAARLLIERGKR